MGSTKMPIKKKSSTIPFGYRVDEENPKLLIEVEEELQALENIIPMVVSKSLSLREGALWLSYKTGRSISHQGLKNIIEQHDSRTTAWLGIKSR